MSDDSSIEWCNATWNPLLGCARVSPGCDSCYAINTATIRAGNPHPRVAAAFEGLTERHEGRLDWTGRINLLPDRLTQPLTWRKPKRIFVNSQSDLFHADVPDDYIARVFAVMALAPQHTFQLLTKRHARMRSLLRDPQFRAVVALEGLQFDDAPLGGRWPLPNVWLGVSVENQQWADIRIPALLATPAAVRWISAEPLLGPLDLSRWLTDPHFNPAYRIARCGQQSAHSRHVMEHGPDRPRNCPGTGGGASWSRRLNWVVCGGESGPGARPMHPDWARTLRDQCTSASVPYFLKQLGQFGAVADQPAAGDVWVAADGAVCRWEPGDGHVRQGVGEYCWPGSRTVLMRRARSKHDAGRELDGREWNEYPQVREVSGV
jgi:protein gp37